MLLHALADAELDDILKGVSRSFYLSLVLLPAEVRPQLSVAYMLARAADTVADSETIARDKRRALLLALREALPDPAACQRVAGEIIKQVSGASSVEKENALLGRLELLFAQLHAFSPGDLDSTVRVLSTLITGMERDLVREDRPFGQLTSMAELDEHTYFAAGCVGEYWTEISYRCVPRLAQHDPAPQIGRGVRLGKGLQYVNVIRDTPNDLLKGRCYLPSDLLATFSLDPKALMDAQERKRALPALRYLQDIAYSHFDAGWAYIEALPEETIRLRIAALLPLWIGLETLAALRASPDPLDPAAPVKIPRQRVYRALAEAAASARLTPLMQRLHRLRRQTAQ